MLSLGNELKQLRASKKWTQAFAAREIGIQQSYLSKLENGQFIPSPEVLEKLSSCYDISFNEYLPTTATKAAQTPKLALMCSLMLFLAITTWLCAHYEIFYPETYFTYQAKLDDFLAFNVTQQYRGEHFIEGDVAYQIVGERQVSRIENRILVVASVVCIFISIVTALFTQRLRFINL